MQSWEQELGELKARLERLETTVDRLASTATDTTLPGADYLSDQEQTLAWFKDEGLVREPTPEEYHLAAQWEDLSEEEQQSHIRRMHHLIFDPPLSQAIIDSHH